MTPTPGCERDVESVDSFFFSSAAATAFVVSLEMVTFDDDEFVSVVNNDDAELAFKF
jgi:hypothetical protein